MTKTNEQSDIEKRKAYAAKVLGLQGSAIQTVQFQLDFVRKRCALVDVYVGGSSLFTARASYAEMSFGDGGQRQGVIKPGIKELIPPEFPAKWRSIEQRARQCPEKLGSRLPGFGFYIAIPYTRWQEFVDKWSAINCEAEAWVGQVIASIPKWRETYIPQTFAKVGAEAWDGLVFKRKIASGQTVVVDKRKFHSRGEFIEYVVNDALDRIPDADIIRKTCAIKYTTSIVGTQADIEAEIARAEKARANREKSLTKQHAEDLKRRKADDEARVSLEAMRQAQLEAAREHILQMGSPIADLMNAWRSEIYQALQTAKETYDRSGTFRGKTLDMLAGLMEVYRAANAGMHDTRLEGLLFNLQRAVGNVRAQKAEDKTMDDVLAAMESLSVDLLTPAQEIIKDDPGRFAFLEID